MNTYYWDRQGQRRISATGITEKTPPDIFYKDKVTHRLLVKDVSGSTITAADLSECTTFAAAVDSDFNHTTTPCCVTLDANIDSSAKATGVLDISFDADTEAFENSVGTNEQKAGWLEVEGYNSDVPPKRKFYARYPITLKNILNPGGDPPAESISNYNTKTEDLALLRAGREFQFSINGSTLWHSTQVEADRFYQERYPGGEWSVAIALVVGPDGADGTNGLDGADGAPGANAPNVQIQYSADGSTSWHTTFTSGDKYTRNSTDGGSTWSAAMKFIGEDGSGAVDSVNGETGTVVLTTADIADSSDKRYCTDAQKTVIGNTSNTNTGDETQSTIKTKLGAAATGADGYLTSTDWNTFNGKQAALGFTPVANSGNETVAGIKTFSSSPIVPAPTTDMQAATKKYVDDNAGGGTGSTSDTSWTGSNWSSTTVSPSTRATQEALKNVGLDTLASSLVSGDDKKLAVASCSEGGLDSYAKLLLHFDNNVTDSSSSANTVTNNSVTFSNSVYKFGSYSAAFNGSAYLTAPDSANWDFASNDGTIDFWIYPTSLTDVACLVGQSASSADGNWFAYTYANGAVGIGINGVNEIKSSASVLTTNTWHHVEIVRVNSTSTTYIFVNGTSVISSTTGVWNNSGNTLFIGGGFAGSYFTGYIDELRISKGVARHTSSFTPPARPYSALEGKYTLSTIKDTDIVTTLTQGGSTGIDVISKSGNTLTSKKIKAGTNVTVTESGNEIAIAASGGSGSGDVVGPASATADDIAVFDSTTGKLIKDGGKKVADLAALAGAAFTGNVAINNTLTGSELALGSSSNEYGSGILLSSENASWSIFQAGSDLAIRDTHYRLYLNSTGFYIGSGASLPNPAYTLDVAGDINCTGNFKINGTNISSGGGSAVNENLIINGDMRIAQRGTSFSAMAINTYMLDRWQYGKVGDAIHTGSQDTDVPTYAQAGTLFQNSLKLACTTADSSIASSDIVYIEQKVEGYKIAPLVGSSVTVSFWVKAYKTGTYCIAFENSGADRSYIAEYSISSSNTWEKKTITIPLNFSGGTWNYTNGIGAFLYFVIACGSNYQGTVNTWNTSNVIATSNQVNGVDSTSDNFWLTGVKLEAGTSATQFTPRMYEDELRLCQRYYTRYGENSSDGNNGITFKGYTTAGNYCSQQYTISPRMRSAPTATLLGTWSKTNVSNIYTLGSTPNTFGIQYQATADGIISVYTNSIDDYIELNSEL